MFSLFAISTSLLKNLGLDDQELKAAYRNPPPTPLPKGPGYRSQGFEEEVFSPHPPPGKNG
jgi:hypothetical protein